MKIPFPHLGKHFIVEPDLGELFRLRSMLRENPIDAIEGLAKLAHGGSRMSMLYIADMLASGKAVEKDLDQAEYWYRQAANRSLMHGNHGLGKLLWDKQQFEMALEQFFVAAGNDFGPALNYIGFMYKEGQGTEVNIYKAREYLERAACQKHYFGTFNLANLLLTGKFGVWQFIRGAILWFLAPIRRGIVRTNDPYSDELRP